MLCPWVKALWNQIDIYCAVLLVKTATDCVVLADKDEDWQVKEEQESGFRCCCIVSVSERGGWLAAWQRQRYDRLPAGSWQKHQMLRWSLLSQSTVFQDAYAVKHKFSEVITLLIWIYPSCSVFVEMRSCTIFWENGGLWRFKAEHLLSCHSFLYMNRQEIFIGLPNLSVKIWRPCYFMMT